MPNPATHPHDAMFKHVLGDPKLAGIFLREHLPADLANLLGSEALEPVPGSFVDEDLKQHHSDLVFSIPLNNGATAFAYNRRPDLNEHLYLIFAEAPELDDRDLSLIVTYIETSPVTLDRATLHEVLQTLIPNRKEKIMRALTQEAFDEGLAMGRNEGKAEGKAETGANMLIQLLRRRFGSLPERVVRRIATADAATLETWFVHALHAPDLASVFVSH